MTQLVVDANVAIKWVLPEIYSDRTLQLLNDDYTLLIPDFFFSEIANILWKRIRRGEITVEAGQEKLTEISLVDFNIFPSLSVISLALEIAVRVQQAVYDCVYLAVAVTNQCQMVTADERFYNALQQDILSHHICWIVDVI